MNKRFAPLTFLLFGLLQSASGGENLWTTSGPPGAFVYDLSYLDDAGGVAVAVTANAIYRTTNHGVSWTQVRLLDTSFPKLFAVNPAHRSQLVVSSEPLWRGLDTGATFTAESAPLDGAGIQSLAFAGDRTL